MATVLVVEDKIFLRYTLAEWLRMRGNEVFEAASGDEAQTVLSTVLEIDLVVTDVQMPGSLDGLQLTRNLQATRPQIPVIIVSGLPLRADAESAGAAAFYPKPYNLEELAARIAELIAQRGPLGVNHQTWQRMTSQSEDTAVETVLVVEHEVMVRLAISEYLRHCGYRVIEAISAEEAITVLSSDDITVEVIFSAAELGEGMNGFALSKWVRDHKTGIEVILAGSAEKSAHEASDLCEEGPHLKKPYEPSQVVDWIKRLRNLKRPK